MGFSLFGRVAPMPYLDAVSRGWRRGPAGRARTQTHFAAVVGSQQRHERQRRDMNVCGRFPGLSGMRHSMLALLSLSTQPPSRKCTWQRSVRDPSSSASVDLSASNHELAGECPVCGTSYYSGHAYFFVRGVGQTAEVKFRGGRRVSHVPIFSRTELGPSCLLSGE